MVMQLNELQDELSFGKYKNKTIGYILNMDPQYITWLDFNVKRIIISKDIVFQAFKKQKENQPIRNYFKSQKPRYRQYEDYERTNDDSDFGMAFNLW
jgi:hypothetical protein